jgi:hypothetical protein
MKLPAAGAVDSAVLSARKAALKKRKSMNFTVTDSPVPPSSHQKKSGQNTVQVAGMRVGSARSPKFKVLASKKKSNSIPAAPAEKEKIKARKEDKKLKKKRLLKKTPDKKEELVKKDVDLFFSEQQDAADLQGKWRRIFLRQALVDCGSSLIVIVVVPDPALKGIVQPFELGGVTRLIRSAIKF